MAPVPLETQPSYVPLAVSATHLVLVPYLTYAVGASLHASYKSLSPSQETRARLSQRQKLIPLFSGLALVSFLVAAYSSARYAVLSYRTWADERGVELPDGLTGENGVLSTREPWNNVYLASWLSDTPIYYDALEIIAEKARRFWWGQQVNLATISWSMLLATEGRRRRIPLLSAYMGLAYLVNLSFAQNLFYLALVLTPAPIPATSAGNTTSPVSRWTRIRNSIMPPKPDNWFPHTALIFSTFLVNLGAVAYLPYAAGTANFHGAVRLVRGATFLPILVPELAPLNWGTVYTKSHDTYGNLKQVFRLLSTASFLLHMKSSVLGLAYNVPDSHYHRHSRLLPWDIEERSTWERSTTALGKMLGSMADHPVVAAVAWDALLGALSLGLWAAVRAIDTQTILSAATPLCESDSQTSPLLSRLRALPKGKTDRKHSREIKSEPETDQDTSDGSRTMNLRRRPGRTDPTSTSRDPTSGSAPKKRGARSRKNPPVEEQAYEPSPAEASAIVEGDEVPAQDLDWESGALAWGLVALGGLGVAGAGVWGAECVAR